MWCVAAMAFVWWRLLEWIEPAASVEPALELRPDDDDDEEEEDEEEEETARDEKRA